MSINPLNDISKVYLEQVASVDEARSIEHMRDRYLKDPKEIAKSRAKNIADRKKKRSALAHMEKQYAGMKAGIYSSYEPEGEIVDEAKKSKKPNDGNLANNYPPYDKITRGDVIAGRLGKDQMGGKKKVKEGFSNWRQDLAEVMNDDENNIKIKEKKVNNKIKINPKLGEAVEEIGGTLLEMVEIDEVDYIVESVYDELLEEGYGEDDIEEALEYALIEAKVTFGHDTEKPYQKKTSAGRMVRAVGRLARQKLASKVGSAKTAAKAAVARGARKVAKGALGVARKMEGGDSKPSAAHTKTRTSSTYRGAGAGTKEKVSSGSYTPPIKKKAEKPADPWEGSATTPPKAKTKKATAPKAKAPAVAPKRKRKSKLDSLLADIRSEEVQINEMPYQVMGSPDGKKEKKIGKPVKSRKYADARAAELEDTHKETGGKYRSQYVEEVQIDEKALSKQQQKFMGMVYAVKKGDMKAPSAEVAKAAAGMTKQQAKDFAKTKHKGLPEVKEQMDDSTEMSASPMDDKKMEQQKKKIQMQKIRDLTVRLAAARKGVY